MESSTPNYLYTAELCDFSDPFDAPTTSAQAIPTPPECPTIDNFRRPYNEAIKVVEGRTGFRLRDGQQESLNKLYNGDDVVLVAATGYGKTTVFTGFHDMFTESARAVTLIVSPLQAIENGQLKELAQLGRDLRPFILDGTNNNAKNRHDIARGDYTHVWLTAEVLLGELCETIASKEEGKSKGKASVTALTENPRARKAPRHRSFADGYTDCGSFTSVLQDSLFRDRLCLVAIDELHLCSSESWGGSFRPSLGQLVKIRDQLDSHTRLFGTTATLRDSVWDEIRTSAGFHIHTAPIRTAVYRPDVFLHMLPTDDPKPLFKRILYSSIIRANPAANEAGEYAPNTFVLASVSISYSSLCWYRLSTSSGGWVH